jgi:hypothetical protein
VVLDGKRRLRTLHAIALMLPDFSMGYGDKEMYWIGNTIRVGIGVEVSSSLLFKSLYILVISCHSFASQLPLRPASHLHLSPILLEA